MAERELIPTRIALLELTEERHVVREGYELLDEKRMLLAARILKSLDTHAAAAVHAQTTWQELLATYRDALSAHGLHELEIWPPRVTDTVIERRAERVLGLELDGAVASLSGAASAWSPARASPPIAACIETTRAFVVQAVAIAALESELSRLGDEYRRTERRTQAIEQVLLPELDADLRNVAAALEALDQEEVVRVHSCRGAPF